MLCRCVVWRIFLTHVLWTEVHLRQHFLPYKGDLFKLKQKKERKKSTKTFAIIG